MSQITIPVPDELLLAMNVNEEEISLSMCTDYAMKQFAEGKLTIVQAARFCGMNIYDFMTALSQAGVPVIDYSTAELEQELALLNL